SNRPRPHAAPAILPNSCNDGLLLGVLDELGRPMYPVVIRDRWTGRVGFPPIWTAIQPCHASAVGLMEEHGVRSHLRNLLAFKLCQGSKQREGESTTGRMGVDAFVDGRKVGAGRVELLGDMDCVLRGTGQTIQSIHNQNGPVLTGVAD